MTLHHTQDDPVCPHIFNALDENVDDAAVCEYRILVWWASTTYRNSLKNSFYYSEFHSDYNKQQHDSTVTDIITAHS